jgi:hypothetical protein
MSRKAFNFYRSYYEVAQELNDKDRLAFYDALIQVQFTGIVNELTGMAKFAYLSQKHSIELQVSGYNARHKRADVPDNKIVIKQPKLGTKAGSKLGSKLAPKAQEKEKEKEKEKENVFSNSNIFNKNIFAEIFKDWEKEKLAHYYNAANDYSESTGKKYKNWTAAIRSWERKDKAEGKGYYAKKSTSKPYPSGLM